MSQSLMSKVANALSFAHLAGIGQAQAPTAPAATAPAAAAPDDQDDEDPKKQKAGESADEYAARMEEDEKKDGDDDKKDDEKMAVALAAAEAKGYAAGFAAQRDRGATIFAAPAAARNVAMAAEFAFTTDLTAEKCVALLEKAPAPNASVSRPDRTARNPNVGAGAPGAVDPKAATAARWDANLQAARPASRR